MITKYLYIRPLIVLWKVKFKQIKKSFHKDLVSHGFTGSFETLNIWLTSNKETFEVEIRHFQSLINATHIPYQFLVDKELADKFTVNDVVGDDNWIEFWMDIHGYLVRFVVNRQTQDDISKYLGINRDTLRAFYDDKEYIMQSRLPTSKVVTWLYRDGCTRFIHGVIVVKDKQSDVEKADESNPKYAAESPQRSENSHDDIPETKIKVEKDNSKGNVVQDMMEEINRQMHTFAEKHSQDEAKFLSCMIDYLRKMEKKITPVSQVLLAHI